MINPARRRFPTLPLPASGWPLFALLAVFLFAGTVGHDPWKIEDAAHFGVVWRALAADDWLSFRFVTGADSVVEPPLYYWLGTTLADLLSPALARPDAVRLASPLFAGIACTMLYIAARELHGPKDAGVAPLALVGSLGFLVQSHETQPAMALIAGISALYAGLALGPRQGWRAGPLVGVGGAGVVLAHGITLLPALFLGIIVSVFAAPARANSVRTAILGTAFGIALAAPWMWWLHTSSPSAFEAWWNAEVAQFGAVDNLGRNAWRWLEILAWFAWPALPLALWALWDQRRRLAEYPWSLPLVACVLLAANLILLFPARGVIALALLPALALLAVPGLLALRRGAANAFDWFGRMTFSLIASLIWLGWIAMNFGVPSKIARNFAKLAPGFTASVDPVAVAVAAIASLLWLWLMFVRDTAAARSPTRPLVHWVGGMSLIWILATSLWLPWIEHGKTYRGVATAIGSRIPATACIAARSVGEAQHASLDYFLAHRLRHEAIGNTGCGWLLTQGHPTESPPGGDWLKVWEGGRPGDKNERFRLYRRP